MGKSKSNSTKGTWWLPEKPEVKVIGELKQDDSCLYLFGHFFAFGINTEESNFTVWGTGADGTQFTLFECFVKSSSYPLPDGMPTAEISPSMWLIGGHYHDLKSVVLTNLRCDLNHLVHWVGHSSYSFNYDRQFSTFRLEGKNPEPISCSVVDGIEILFSPSLVLSPSDVAIAFRNECHLTVKSGTSRSYEELAEIVDGITQLIALATQHSIYTTRILALTAPKDGDEPSTLQIFRRVPKNAKDEDNLRDDEMLFTLADVQRIGASLVTNFFARRKLFRPALEVLLSDRYNADVYQHQRFLGLAHGIEAFHRIFFGGKYQADDIYQRETQERLLAALPKDLDPDFRRSLKNKLKYLHEFSLRKRITDVVLKHSELIKEVIPDAKAFAGVVADERNRLTHLDQSSSLYDSSEQSLWLMAEQLSLLLELCLISELGFDENVLSKIVVRGRHAKTIRLNLPNKSEKQVT